MSDWLYAVNEDESKRIPIGFTVGDRSEAKGFQCARSEAVVTRCTWLGSSVYKPLKPGVRGLADPLFICGVWM